MNGYLAMIRTREDLEFSVEFPDLPGCIATASSFHEAMALPRLLLPQHLLDLRSQGNPLPEPRSMNELRDSGLAAGAIPVLVPVPVAAQANPTDNRATGS